jgi:cytochrome P450
MTEPPVHLTGRAAVRVGWQMLRDPIEAMRLTHAECGPFIVVSDAVPLPRNPRLTMLGLPLILTAGPEFNEEVLSNPAVWRPVGIFPGGPKNSAARRLGAGLSHMTGRRHAYYRRLVTPPLRRGNVEALGDKMARLADEEIATWPTGEMIDLWAHVRRLMHTLAIGLLFGNDKERGYPIAEMVTDLLTLKWSPSARLCAINLPITPYGRMLHKGATLEGCILDWAETRRGHLDSSDLLSIIVNSPEEDGSPVRDTTIVGMMPQLYGAVFETCQIVLIWTLILIAQHPRFARDLLEELQERFAGAPLTLQNIAELARLEAAIKESLRILPPVAMQVRVAQQDTSLAGFPVPRGGRALLSAFITNRLPDRYPEPDSFRPERWASIDPTAYEFLCFSAGPRNCPGYWLGMAMVKVAIATILLHHRVELAAQERIDYIVRPALIPRGKVRATLHRQDGNFAAALIRGNISTLVRGLH